MNKITLRLTVNEGHEESFDNFTANKSINNVSSLIGTPTTRSGGRYGKSLAKGYLTFYNGNLGNKDTKLMSEVNKYNGYMFGVTDSDGKYSLTLTLNGSNFDRIIIYGDADAEQWAITAIVDGKTIYSDDGIWAIVFEEEKNTHTIEFTEWNKSNYNACITHIDVMLKYLELDNFWIDNVDSTSQSVPAPNEITYGVLANSGGANIRDLDGEFYDYIQDGILPNSNIPVSLFVNGKQVQAHITNDSDYNETDTMLSLQFTNRLSDWDTLIYGGRNLTDSMSAYSLLLEVLQTLGFAQVDVNEMLDSNMLYGNDNQAGSVKDYLEEITIEYPYLESASYRETINKVCTLAQLNVFENDSGKIKFVSARPVVLQEQIDNSIKVTDTYLAEDLQKTIVLKNSYSKTRQPVRNYYNAYTMVKSVFVDFTGLPSPSSTGEDDDGNSYNLYNRNIVITRKNGRPTDNNIQLQNCTILSNPYSIGSSIADYYTSIIKVPLGTLNEYISKKTDFVVNSNNSELNTYATGNIGARMVEEYQKYSVSKSVIYTNENDILSQWISGGSAINVPLSKTFDFNILKDGDQYYCYIYQWKYQIVKVGTTGYTYILNNINYDITLLDVRYTDNLYENGSGENVELNGNELIANNTQYDNIIGIPILISNNITTDYANGVSNGTATIFMGDYYNSAGERVLEWEKGEIAQVGQVVYFENDLKPDRTQRYWKITGRTFRWDSSPLVDLQLQEVRVFA